MMFGVGLMGQVGGVVGVSPPPTTAMEAWYRKGVGITSAANAVSKWANQAVSGSARDYVQATGASQPTLQGDGTILFDGSSDYLQIGFTLNQPYTRYLRLKQVSWSSSAYITDGFAAANSSVLQQFSASPSISIYAQGVQAAANANLAVGVFGSVGAVFNGASSVLNINGTETTGNPGVANPGGLTIGASAGGVTWSNIQVAEEIIYSVAHDAATRAAVIAYLNTL